MILFVLKWILHLKKVIFIQLQEFPTPPYCCCCSVTKQSDGGIAGIFLAKRSIVAYSIPYIFWKLLFQRLIWHIWGPAMCILWPVRFFVTLWESTGSISWNLVVCTCTVIWSFLSSCFVNEENIFLHPHYLQFQFSFTSQSAFVKRKSCKLDLQRLKRKEKDWVGLDFRDSRCILR